ncbi:MAG: hypothetical protein ACXW2U_13290 [Telluria sp.]
MNDMNLNAALLRLRLGLPAIGPVAGAAAVLCLAGAAALAWLVPQRALQVREHELALRVAAVPPAPVAKAAPLVANENLDLFYASLGERRYAEQQVATLFGLAAKSGLTLSQGEYKAGYERNARLHTYQVILPVKGSYPAVWKFGMESLRAIPFASLDEISFRRDAINQATVEARVRLTLYLADPAGGQR